MNTSGSEPAAGAAEPRRRVRPGGRGGWSGFAETLGRFFQDPRRALEGVHSHPHLGQGFAALCLGLLARFQVRMLEGTAGAADFIQVLAGGLILWLVLPGLWHGVSRLFKKTGSYKTLLCLAAWSASLYWLALPMAHLAATTSALASVHRVFQTLLGLGFLYLVWTGLRFNYGWSRAGGLAVLAVPSVLFLGLMTMVSALAVLASSLAGAALTFKLFP